VAIMGESHHHHQGRSCQRQVTFSPGFSWLAELSLPSFQILASIIQFHPAFPHFLAAFFVRGRFVTLRVATLMHALQSMQ